MTVSSGFMELQLWISKVAIVILTHFYTGLQTSLSLTHVTVYTSLGFTRFRSCIKIIQNDYQ